MRRFGYENFRGRLCKSSRYRHPSIRTSSPADFADSQNIGFLTSQERDERSGDGNLENERGGSWTEIQARISTAWPYEDNGSVEGRRYPVRSTGWGNRCGIRVECLWRLERPYKQRSATIIFFYFQHSIFRVTLSLKSQPDIHCR
ncbi:hypothetical protein DPMN_072937 [Dreissena polymorpha]|uniref:Uncharacterized protein n=1 Tax=Dreissena polymorpha TaxID=45954 RepID=A0A9D4BY47_DREPO|nr:hypothetical protein DPMN_072937 [Dreissena polymorpha]